MSRRLLALALIGGATVGPLAVAQPALAEYGPFADPEPVTIVGYPASAEEPFITADGRYLLFNSSEAGAEFTLQYATALNADTFEYDGAILGEAVNEPGSLSGTPTLDTLGDLFFISNRSYFETLSTVYESHFSQGTVTGVHLVPGVSGARPGLVDFDVGVSPEGSSLYVSVGQFGEGESPSNASIVLYERGEVGGFVEAPNSATLLEAVNETGRLNYGAAVTADGLELFYTAATPALGIAPSVYRAARASTAEPFGDIEKVAAIAGFAEAPTITSDGKTLYYHQKAGSEVQIMEVTRPSYAPAMTLTRLTPARGPASGGTSVRIMGTNLAGVSAVDFGSSAASSVHVVSPSEVTAVSPPAASGPAAVSVTSAEGTTEPAQQASFRFSPPSLTEVSPRFGELAGGTVVTLRGSGFTPGEAGTKVLFGRVAAGSVWCASTTTCTALTSAARRAGSVQVEVVSDGRRNRRGGTSDAFIFELP